MSFGNNLRTLIKERNTTQKEVANQLNIAPSTLGSYIQNVREPDFSTLKIIAEYFEVSIDYLLDHNYNQISSKEEKELLRIFRSLSKEQQHICIEQCKVFVKLNYQKKDN